MADGLVLKLVADFVGVRADDAGLATLVGLDVAPLDLDEVLSRLEPELGITLPEREVRSVRTYGDLVQVVTRLLAERDRRLGVKERRLRVAMRVEIGSRGRSTWLHRSGRFTADLAETMRQDLRTLRDVRRAIVVLPADASDDELARVGAALAAAHRPEVALLVARDGDLPADGEPLGRAPAIEASTDFVMLVGELLRAAGDERALACLYAATGDAAVRHDFEKQTYATRLATDRLARSVDRGAADIPADARRLATDVLVAPSDLDGVRAEVLAESGDPARPFERYSQYVGRLLEAAGTIATVTPDAEYARQAKAFLALLQARETVAAERGMACALASGTVAPSLFAVALRALVDAQARLLEAFETLADPEVVDVLRQNRGAQAFVDAERAVERALATGGGASADVERARLFGLLAAKLERLREVEEVQLGALRRHAGVQLMH